ncbi:MAG: Holliday junction branch migration protein RuvA [Nocardioidaceae bacterium]
MIAFVRGRVAAVGIDSAVIEVGGVGMQVMCTPGTLAELRTGDQAQLATSMVVREDSLTLFGFADEDERSLFELVQTASGVGPKLAQAMLAVHGPDELRRAVTTEDLVALTKVPGIGRKGAQRIVLELKDRIGAPTGATGTPAVGSRSAAGGWRDQVHGALLGLGWSAREAELAVDAVADEAGDQPDVPTLLRSALRTLSKA